MSVLKKFGVADVLIILLIIITLVGLNIFSGPSVAKAGTPVSFTLQLSPKKADFAKNIVTGDKVYDAVHGYYLGTVASVTTGPYYDFAPDTANKVYVKADVPDGYYYYVVITADAVLSDTATMVGGQYDIEVGKQAPVRTAHFASTSTITDITYQSGN